MGPGYIAPPTFLGKTLWSALPLALLICTAPAQDPGTVTIDAAVTDKHGDFPNLETDSFTLFEDKKPQVITLARRDDRPVSIGLVVDDSGSMTELGPSVGNIIAALLGPLDSRDEISLVLFNKQPFLIQDFTQEKAAILTGLERGQKYGPSAVLDACNGALRHLVEHGKHYRKVLILVSDGLDNSSKTKQRDLERTLIQAGVSVYALGLEADFTQPRESLRGKVLLNALAKPAGGKVYQSSRANELKRNAEEIASDIHNQWLISYVPTNKSHEGLFRRIDIRVKGASGVLVRARSGYYQ